MPRSFVVLFRCFRPADRAGAHLLNSSRGHIMTARGNNFADQDAEPMRWPLRYQILFPFAALTLAAIVAVSALAAILAAQRAQRQIEEQLRSIVATLADSTFPLTDAVLKQMSGLSGADFLFFNPDGRLLAASRAIRFPPEQATSGTKSTEPRLGPPVNIDGQCYFEMASWIDGRGTRGPGRLTILYPERIWRWARDEAVWPPLVIGALTLLATGGIALVLAGRLAGPILELRRQVNRIAEADFAPMPLPQRNDEIRDLAAAVNRLARQLTEMDQAIRRSERLALLGQLAGGLVHHLRNNVTGALMAVQLHARQCEVDQESLEVAIRQLSLTEQHLKQFLAAPPLEQGIAVQSAPCQGQAIIDDAVALLGPSLRHRRVSLEAIRGENSSIELLADPNLLRQLLVNLLLNAADAAGPGGRIKIEIDTLSTSDQTANAGSYAVLRVLDSGPGLRPDIADRLFEPFATTKSEGVGLGLAVAQQIAHAHGGQIVFSRQNGETCCEVHLPLAQTAASPS